MPADKDRILLDFAKATFKSTADHLASAAKLIESLETPEPSDPSLPAPAAPKLRVKGRDPMSLQFFVGVTPSPAADPTVTFATVEHTAIITLPDGTPPTTLPVISNTFGGAEFNLPGSYPVGAHIAVTEVQVTSDGKRTKVSPASSLLVTDPTVIDATPLAPGLRVVGPDPATV